MKAHTDNSLSSTLTPYAAHVDVAEAAGEVSIGIVSCGRQEITRGRAGVLEPVQDVEKLQTELDVGALLVPDTREAGLFAGQALSPVAAEIPRPAKRLQTIFAPESTEFMLNS
ncbi:MAG: hypothetical protein ABSF25_27305, partial [Bryobacteraceae bacterium]